VSEPFIFVTTHAIADGELARIRELGPRFAERVEAADTGLLAFHFHIDEAGREVTNVQVHRDAASMDAYLPLVEDLIREALDASRTLSVDVFGTPGPLLRSVLHHNEEQGARVRVRPEHLAGFTRVPAAL
jgi:hypothetical protein